MKTLRLLLICFAATFASFVSAQNSESTSALSHISTAIETLAETNGIDMKVKCSIDGPQLTVAAVMTDEDDSIDYIAGYITRPNALAMITPVFAPVLAANDAIEEVHIRITDQNDQFIDYNFTSGEILDSYNR